MLGTEFVYWKKIKFEKYAMASFLLKFVFVFSAAISFFAVFSYQTSTFFKEIDVYLNYRISLAYRALIIYPITFLGSKVEWTLDASANNPYFYVDCSYIQIALQNGIIALLIVILCYTILLKKSIVNENIVTVWCLVILALHSITDPQLLNLAYNPFILLIPSIFVMPGYKGKKQLLA